MEANHTELYPNGQPQAALIDSTPQLPTRAKIPFRPEGVPQELRDLPQWVGWRPAWRDNVPGNDITKPPLCVRNGTVRGMGYVDQPRTWATFDDALRAWEAFKLAGLGIVLSPEAGLVGLDLDHALDATGKPHPWGGAILQRFPDAYTEWSPSGTGFRLFLRGTLPASFGRGRKCGGLGDGSGALEVYGAGRYLTVTGARLPSSPVCVTTDEGELAALLAEYFPNLVTDTEGRETVPRCSPGPVALDDAALDDEALLKKMLSDPRKGAGTRAVWVGDDSAFDDDESRGDQSLLRELAYWTDKDPARMERLFNQSLRANREKWRTRADYRDGSIAKAIAITGKTYSRPAQVMTLRGVTHTERGEALPLPWGQPHPLGDPALPEFPILELPFALREFVQAVAVETQTPLALPGMVALGTLAMACARRWRIEVRPGWQEPLGLFVLPTANPGARKSAVFSRFTRVVELLECEEAQRMGAEVQRVKSQRGILESRLKRAESAAGKTIATDPRALAEEEALALRVELSNLETPTPPRFFLDDCTPERLVLALDEHGGSMAFLSAESAILENIAGRYSDGKSNLDSILKGHAGDSIRVARVNRPSLWVESPALTLSLCVQPRVLHRMGSEKDFSGRGLLARFLFALPEDKVGWRDSDAPPVPPSMSAEYEARIRALLLAGAGEHHGRHLLPFKPKAHEAMVNFLRTTETRLRPGGDLDPIREWGSKLAGAVARIAALLQLAATGPTADSVSDFHVDSAVRMTPFLVAHALAAFRMMGEDPALETAKRILRWIGERKRFTRREVHQALRGSANPTPESFDPALKLLEEAEWIRLQPREDRPEGGRPSVGYDVNPLAKETPRGF